MPEPKIRVTPQRWKAEVTLHAMAAERPEFGDVVLIWSFACVCWIRAVWRRKGGRETETEGEFMTLGQVFPAGDVEFWAELPPELDDQDLPDPMDEMPEPGKSSKRWRWLGDEMATHLCGTFPENWGWEIVPPTDHLPHRFVCEFGHEKRTTHRHGSGTSTCGFPGHLGRPCPGELIPEEELEERSVFVDADS